MSQLATTPAALTDPRPPPRRPRIVAAITARERSLFLDRALAQSGLAGRIEFAVESDLAGDAWERTLDAWQPQVLITGWATPPLPADWIGRADCPLCYVCHLTGAVRQLVPRAFIERGGLVTNWGDSISGQVAEHGLLLALAALRNLGSWPEFIRRPPAERQITDLQTRTLFGLRVGLHGFGGIARALVPLLKPFDVSLAAFSAGVPGEIMTRHGVRPRPSLAELFAESDVLFECESLTAATRGSVSAAVLGALPVGAVFVNIGRGGLVDDEALQRAAATGRLRVALDVLAVEPLTPASPYVSIPGVILSPHIGGPTLDRYADCGARALANLTAYLDGTIPAGAITLAMFDRAT